MKSIDNYQAVLEVSDIHANKLKMALTNLQHLLPFTAEKITNLKELDFLYLELFGNRFSKLQDYMGSTLFDVCLTHSGDISDGITIIDKVNKLIKYDLIASEAVWRELRKARNHLAHEYPTQPELTAKYVNETVDLAEQLLTMYDKIKIFLNK